MVWRGEKDLIPNVDWVQTGVGICLGWAVKFYRGSRDDRVRGKVRVWVKQGSEPAVHT